MISAATGSGSDILGLRLPHPICVASGMITDGLRQIRRLFEFGAAAIVTKTIFEGERAKSDEKIRSFAHGAVNSTTFSHRSTDAWRQDLAELATTQSNVVVSIHAQTPALLGRLAECLASCCPYPFELGIACPTDGSDDGLTPELLMRYVRAVKSAADRPLAVKLGANERACRLAGAAQEAGADALSISDSLPGLLLIGDPPMRACQGQMGYSGAGIKPIVLHSIVTVRNAGIDLPVLGIGGIGSARDVADFLSIGCVAVQVYTELMRHGDRRLSSLVAEWHERAGGVSVGASDVTQQPAVTA